MQISEKRRQELYNAIHEEVMKLRIEVKRNPPDSETLDLNLARLTEKIWLNQCTILRIQ